MFRKVSQSSVAENEGGGDKDPEVVEAEEAYVAPQAARPPAPQWCGPLNDLD
jgi:hypothetical protein